MRPSLIRNGVAVCDRFCEQRRRSASPEAMLMVAICVTTREWLYSSARVPITVYGWLVTKATRSPGR